MWTLAAVLFAAIAGATAVAVNYYGLPEWLPLQRPTFGVGRPGLELDFPKAQQRKEPLEKSHRRGAYSSFSIHETKRELVSAVPFRDRVVHYALCDLPGLPAASRKGTG